jgi:hypothetical protein
MFKIFIPTFEFVYLTHITLGEAIVASITSYSAYFNNLEFIIIIIIKN